MTNQIPIINVLVIKGFEKPEDIIKISTTQNKQSGERTYYKVEKPPLPEKYRLPHGYAQVSFQII